MATLSELTLSIADAVEERDIHSLRKISNRALEQVSLNNQKEFLLPSILSYSFAKAMQKPHYWKGRSPSVFFGKAVNRLAKAAVLAESDTEGAQVIFTELLTSLADLDSQEKRYMKGIIEKARLKVASTLYAQGFSLDSALEMTGANKRELLAYIGKTTVFEKMKSVKTMKERLKSLRDILS